ncbi:MAG: HAD-IA family hydrolase [Candidatus Micrarchaeota archaeon]
MKKIIFFDGDGTVWRLRPGTLFKHPVDAWKKSRSSEEARGHFEVPDSHIRILRLLRDSGIYLVILSTSPHTKRYANKKLTETVRHFKLDRIFNEIHAADDYPGSKGEHMLRILLKRRIKKKEALMVGDSQKWDYSPAKKVGIDALLLRRSYNRACIVRKIDGLDEVSNYLDK